MSTPYADAVAPELPYRPDARIDVGLIRDVLAVALVLLGAAGLAVMAFAVDWRAGVATVSAYSIVAGVYLGYER